MDEDDLIPTSHKFAWRDRLACVEALALSCDDNGGKFDQALRQVRLTNYAYNARHMLVKQRNQLRRDVLKRLKDIQHMRDSADVGDIVRVPRMVATLLPGGGKRDGRKLVEAEIIRRTIISSAPRYTVRRLDDGGEQTGNGHMIKSIVRRAARPEIEGGEP